MTMRRIPLGDIGNTITTASTLTTHKESVATVGLLGSVLAPAQLGANVGSTVAGVATQRHSSLNIGSPRVDDRHRGNPQYVADYVKEIYEHFRKNEAKYKPGAYMARQSEITEKMRSVLVDWLVDVHLKFKLKPETFFLTIAIIDRFLDQRNVTKPKLQLVGIVALLIASKYEEIYPPEVEKYIYISANTYTRDEVLKWERLMLATLEYNITMPTVWDFLKRGLQVADVDPITSRIAHYLAELAVLDYKSLEFLPSMVAASCIFLANKLMGAPDSWSYVLEYYTHYKSSALLSCSKLLLETLRNVPKQPKLQAIAKKYNHAKFDFVSRKVEEEQLYKQITL